MVMIWLALGSALSAMLLVFLGSRVGGIGTVLASGGTALLASGFGLGAVSYRFQEKQWHTKLVGGFATALNGGLLVIILACVVRVLLDLIPGFSRLPLVGILDRVFGPAWEVGTALLGQAGTPPRVGPVPTAPIFVGILMVLGRIFVNWGTVQVAPSDEDRALSVPTSGRHQRGRAPEAAKRATAAGRRVAVASYSEAKALLAGTQMDLTFLAMDVVGSTRIKQGEDPYVIEQAFADYRKLVERVLRRHGAYKQTWTPDGQMAAFRTPQSAVDSGRDIVLALPDFNRNVSKMRLDFRLRVGANSGVVSCDDEIPMEEMSDFTIDVAGHMQKHADEDSIWISEEVYQQLVDKTGFEPNDQEVDGRRVYVWKRPT